MTADAGHFGVAVVADDVVGESPVWSVAEDALYWVDVLGRAVHRISAAELNRRDPPSTAASGDAARVQTWTTSADVGAIGLWEPYRLIGALEDGIFLLDLEAGTETRISAAPANIEDVQFNDGKCDRLGRFWVGTMDRDERLPLAALYRLGRGEPLTVAATSIITSNGLGWSPDGQTMYHTDTWTRTITAYDFDAETGAITQPRIFARDETSQPGVPDGLTVDADGCVWSAKWDGWRIVRYTPDGAIDRIVPTPVARPTSCAFGGPNLDRLYVTTARWELTETDVHRQPWAGSVLVLDPGDGIRGLPEEAFVA